MNNPQEVRFEAHWKVGAFAVSAAGIGDFFSPKSGYCLTLAVAAVALFFSIIGWQFPGTPTANEQQANSSTVASKQYPWHWYRPWQFLIFAVVLGAVGWKSWSHAAEGGIAASALPAVAQMQTALGLMQQTVKLQQETREAVDHLSSTVKKETSDNPRKELFNRGVTWTEASFGEALDKRDVETIGLFLQGRFSIVDSKFLMSRIGMRYLSDSEFNRYRSVMEQLHAGGFDFISTYADQIDRTTWDKAPYERRGLLYTNPVMQALRDGNIDLAHWLVDHGDASRLTAFEEVLASALQHCPENKSTLTVATFLIHAGIPVGMAIKAVEASPNGPRTQSCQRIMAVLRQ